MYTIRSNISSNLVDLFIYIQGKNHERYKKMIKFKTVLKHVLLCTPTRLLKFLSKLIKEISKYRLSVSFLALIMFVNAFSIFFSRGGSQLFAQVQREPNLKYQIRNKNINVQLQLSRNH